MKIFLKKFLIFSLPIAIFLIITEAALRDIPNNYTYKRDYIQENLNKIEVLILGNSHSFYGLNPKYLNGHAFNAANLSQSLLYDFEILKKYATNMPKLNTVIVPISYLSLFTTLAGGEEAWRAKNYKIYFDIDAGTTFTHNFEITNTRLKDNFSRINKYYIQNTSDISCTAEGVGINNAKHGHDYVKNTGKTAAARHTVKTFDKVKDNLAALDSIAKICREKNIKLVLVTLPAYESYRSNINKEQYELSQKIIKSFISSHGNCTYTNYFDDDSFGIEDFIDADHLNAGGAKKLSLMLNKNGF